MSPTKKTIIILIGASHGGKSTIVNEFVKYNENSTVMSFATYLKEDATLNGWSGNKDEEGRKFLQEHADNLKKQFGEDVFRRKGLELALASDKDIVLFDDGRHYIELACAHNVVVPELVGHDVNIIVIDFYSKEAEDRWFNACMSFTKETAWARHRSESDWRSVRDRFPRFVNDRTFGVEHSARKFNKFVHDLIAASVPQEVPQNIQYEPDVFRYAHSAFLRKRKHRGILVLGFPGVGKSHYSKHAGVLTGKRTCDSDSSSYSWQDPVNKIRHPDFPNNYIDALEQQLEHNDIVFASTHAEVRSAIQARNIPYVIVFPAKHLKTSYIERYKNRGSDAGFIALMEKMFDTFVQQLLDDKCEVALKVKLNSPNHFMDDALMHI